MLDFITTPLKKEMTDKEIKKAIRVFSKWESENLKIVTGKKHSNVSDTYGLAYTSSSAFAGLWNCNTIAESSKKENFFFDGLAIAESGFTCAIFTEYNKDGEEIRTVCIAIE